MSPPTKPSPRQLSYVGITIVRREPLIVCCQQCHAEWRAHRGPGQRLPRNYWKCQNGCNVQLD